MLTLHDCVQKVYNCTKITEEMVANISNRFLKKNPKEIKMKKMRERERDRKEVGYGDASESKNILQHFESCPG